MAKLSIIVPIYKVEPYLRHCIESILKQTFSDFELILVDDGSPDHCPQICDDYAQEDSRIRVIHRENGGLSAARNSGMEIAKGEYILFCDSDDSVSMNWCESLLAAVKSTHDNFIFGKMHSVFENQGYTQFKEGEIGDIQEYNIDDFLKFHVKSSAGYACNVLFYRDVILKLNLKFRKDIIIEDLPFCLAYLHEMSSMSYCPSAVYHYLQRNIPTLSRKYYQDGFRKWQEKYREIQSFIQHKVQKKEEAEEIIAEAYLYRFLNALNNTFDSRNTLSWMQKMRYNQKVVSSVEFQHCLHHCKGNNENQTYLNFLKKGNYRAAYFYEAAAKIKNKITHRN